MMAHKVPLKKDLLAALEEIHRTLLTEPSVDYKGSVCQFLFITQLCENAYPALAEVRRRLTSGMLKTHGMMAAELDCSSCGFDWSGIFPADLEWAPCPQCGVPTPTPLEES
jgi:hypothetical protein